MSRLFESEGKRRKLIEEQRRMAGWGGSYALVPVDAERCPHCRSVLRATGADQRALFYFGGYGETKRSRLLTCECGWQLDAGFASVSPRERSR